MLRNAYLARTSAATIALVACVYLMMSDTRAEAATGASESQKESTLIRIWHALFRSDSAENQADTLFADEPAEKEPADNTTDTEASIRSSVDGKGDLFRSDPQYKTDYNALRQIDVYGGKSVVDPPRPLLELGRLQYTSGKYDESST
ncbi:MAG: hypothetical protein WCB71_02770, partial [Aestuariivirga sp.]